MGDNDQTPTNALPVPDIDQDLKKDVSGSGGRYLAVPDIEKDLTTSPKKKEQKKTSDDLSDIPEVKAARAEKDLFPSTRTIDNTLKYGVPYVGQQPGEKVQEEKLAAQQKQPEQQAGSLPVPDLQADLKSTSKQPSMVDQVSAEFDKTGPYAMPLPQARKLFSTLDGEQRKQLLEQHKWGYNLMTPEQKDEQFLLHRKETPFTHHDAENAIGNTAVWGLNTALAGGRFVADEAKNLLYQSVAGIAPEAAKKASEQAQASERNLIGAIPATATEAYRMLKKVKGDIPMSSLASPSLVLQIATLANDPRSGSLAFIDHINRMITGDTQLERKHWDQRMAAEGEDSANDWKARQGEQKLSPWSQWLYSPFGQAVMQQRERSIMPSAKIFAALTGTTEEQADVALDTIAEKNADANSRELAQKWNQQHDQAMQDFGGIVLGPVGQGPAGLALGAVGIARKIGGALETLGMGHEAVNAYMTAKQARQALGIEKATQKAAQPAAPFGIPIGKTAETLVKKQEELGIRLKNLWEKIPEPARPFVPLALKYAGLAGAGGVVGEALEPEYPRKGLLLGITFATALGAAPRVALDIDRARRAIAGGEGSVLQRAGSSAESSAFTRALFGGNRGKVAGYLAKNIGLATKAGVDLGLMNIATSAINSDDPQKYTESVLNGFLTGVGFHAMGESFKGLHETPMRDAIEDRKKRDIEIHHAISNASEPTKQNLNKISDFSNAVNRAKMHTLMMQAKLSDAMATGDQQKITQAQKAVEVAQALQSEIMRANVQTRNEYGRQFRSLYADIHALANGSRSGQGRLKMEVLTTDQIADRLKKESDAQKLGRSDMEILADAKRPGRYSFNKGTGEFVVNADNIMRRQTLFGESPLQALLHEGAGHGLYNIPEFRRQNREAEALLFDKQERDLAGNVLSETKGKFSNDELVKMYEDEYLKEENQEGKIQFAKDSGLWDEKTNSLNRENVANYMKEEVIAELNAGNLRQGLGKLKQDSTAIDNWLTHRRDSNMADSAIRSLTGMGAKPIYSELLGTDFDPEIVAANRAALAAMAKQNGHFEDATETESGTELPEKVLRANPVMRRRYSLNGGEFKTQMVAEIRDKDGKLVGRPVPVADNAAEGTWTHNESTNEIEKQRGYGQLHESVGWQVPIGGRVEIKRDFVYEPDGKTPIRNSDKEINKLADDRAEAIRQALDTDDRWSGVGLIPVSADGESLSGIMSPKQIQAIKDISESILPLALKEKIFQLNETMARGDGSTFDFDYAARLKGKKYKGRRSEIYGVAPIGWGLSKVGNFYNRSISLGALFRKVKARKKLMPGWYAPWGGSTEEFMDEFRNTYLKNTQLGKDGWLGLDPAHPSEKTDLAILKQNRFNDMMNLASTNREVTPRDPGRRGSKAGDLDNLWRSFRIDSIADMAETPERKYPMDAKRVYQNLMPRDVSEDLNGIQAQHSPEDRGFGINYAGPTDSLLSKTPDVADPSDPYMAAKMATPDKIYLPGGLVAEKKIDYSKIRRSNSVWYNIKKDGIVIGLIPFGFKENSPEARPFLDSKEERNNRPLLEEIKKLKINGAKATFDDLAYLIHGAFPKPIEGMSHYENDPELRTWLRKNKSTNTGSVLERIYGSKSSWSEIAKSILENADSESLNVPINQAAGTRSWYYGQGDNIKIGRGKRETNPDQPWEYIHEIIHGNTSLKVKKALGTDVQGKPYFDKLKELVNDPEFDEDVKDLVNIYFHAIKNIPTKNEDSHEDLLFNKGKGGSYSKGGADQTVKHGGLYELGNLDEFLAGGLADRDFVKKLEGISSISGKKNLFQDFTNWIRKALGMPEKDQTLLDDTINAIHRIAKRDRASFLSPEDIKKKREDNSAADFIKQHEHIRSAAVEDHGNIQFGKSHMDADRVLSLYYGNTRSASAPFKFLTSENRLVDRYDAYKLALNAGQIEYGARSAYPEDWKEGRLRSGMLKYPADIYRDLPTIQASYFDEYGRLKPEHKEVYGDDFKPVEKTPGDAYMPRDIERETGENRDFARPPEEEKAITALYENKRDKFGSSRDLKEGHPVSLRIDIPAYKRGAYVVTVHEQSGSKGGVGDVIGYDTHARVYDPVFSTDEKQAGKVAAGGAKTPLATVMGDFNPSREVPKDIDQWTPIGFDPKEHSFFYDKATDQPVVSGDEAYSVGNTVFVKNPVYGEKSDYAYQPREVDEEPTGKMGININDSTQDYTGQILRGEKTVETRDNPTSLAPYVGKEVGLVRTGKGKATLVGKATVGEPKVYNNKAEFNADFAQHQVGPESEHYIKPGQKKWGFPLTNVQSLEESPVDARGNVARKVSFTPREVNEEVGAAEDQEPMEHRDPVVQGNIPESVDNAATLENAFNVAGGQKWQKGRDLKVALQQNVKDEAAKAGVDVSVPSPQTTEYLVRVGKKDALVALKQNANAIGWYDIKTRLAMRIMSLMHPEIMTDENARVAFTWALATTSNGLKVGKNFQLAERAYRKYKETGVMPNDIGTGTAKAAINESLDLFNTLSKEWGVDNLRQFMQTHFSVAEITAIDKALKPGGEHASTVVKGASILGPKISNGFFSNLYGNFDALTMDRWLVRTWGRWAGTLIEEDPLNTQNQRNRLQKAVEAMSPEDKASMSELVGKDVSKTPVDELAVAIQKSSMKPEKREAMPDEFRLSGNGLAKYLDGQKEAPAGPHERTYIRSVFSQILDELHQMPEYKDLTMADLQAVLWYGEKRLYETAKVKVDDENDPEGYSDEEAPDYANAAAEVARENGVSQRKIDNATALENGRTANTQSGVQVPGESSGEQGTAGGFTTSQKRTFVQTRAVARVRSSRSGDEEQSFSYSRGSGGGSKRTRVLKSLGIRYTDEWKGGSALKRIFKNNKIAAPSYLELDNSDSASVQKFANLIAESKKSTPWGASVYVYPAENYKNMTLLLSKDGKSGCAVKQDGDIVSVFSHSDSNAGRAALEAAIGAGGNKLDCFDTVLPAYYSAHGFKAVSRLNWDDSQSPEGWDKSVYAKHNNGQPDVVFMVHDPAYYGSYSKKDGKVVDSYDKAVDMQKRAVNKVKKTKQSSPGEQIELKPET